MRIWVCYTHKYSVQPVRFARRVGREPLFLRPFIFASLWYLSTNGLSGMRYAAPAANAAPAAKRALDGVGGEVTRAEAPCAHGKSHGRKVGQSLTQRKSTFPH